MLVSPHRNIFLNWFISFSGTSFDSKNHASLIPYPFGTQPHLYDKVYQKQETRARDTIDFFEDKEWKGQINSFYFIPKLNVLN